jgi:hypothetical protein
MAFSLVESKLEAVLEYVSNQEEHHKRLTFQDEYRAFLKGITLLLTNVTCGIDRWRPIFLPYRAIAGGTQAKAGQSLG